MSEAKHLYEFKPSDKIKISMRVHKYSKEACLKQLDKQLEKAWSNLQGDEDIKSLTEIDRLSQFYNYIKTI